MPQIEVIVNAGSGSVLDGQTDKTLTERFIALNLQANIHLAKSGAEIPSLAKSAVESDAEIIVAGGGDGTISAVAAEVSRSGKTLGVLPLGTLNNFSKDLNIPQDLDANITIIADGNTKMIDVGQVNDRIFVNNSSIGLYPRIVRKREQQQRLGYGKWRAAVWAALRMFRLSPFLKVRLEMDGRSFRRKTPFVFVGNNRYEMDLYNIGRRPSLEEAKLTIYLLRRSGRWGVVMLIFHTLTGRLKQWSDFEELQTESVTIQTRKRLTQVAFDGEVGVLETPLEYKILPRSLRVLVPRVLEEDNSDA